MQLLSRFRIAGHSMVPSLLPGDEILISSIPYFFSKPKKNDIVLFTQPQSDKKVIKRIIDLKDRKLYVEGDNVSDSTDSRHYGWIDRDNLLGKMLIKL